MDKEWTPHQEGTSLYIRPTMIATKPYLGVSASDSYLYYVLLSPSGAYYASGLAPVGIYVEDELVRAVRGGVGIAKTGGNYSASILAGVKAKKLGYAQVLWLDGVEQRYVEEVGAMNMMFVYENKKIVTPALNGSILSGITRDSTLKLANYLGYEAEERARRHRRGDRRREKRQDHRGVWHRHRRGDLAREQNFLQGAGGAASATTASARSPRNCTIRSPASSTAR